MKYLLAFLFILFFPTIIFAADIEIIEAQTDGAGGSYDECVKIKNNSLTSISISGWKLQSRSATQDRWVSRSGDGFEEININAGAIVVLASANYSGTDEIWRHTSRWGLSSEGGGARLIDQNGNIMAEKYWGSLINLNQVEQPAPTPEPQNGPEPISEIQPSPETTPQQSDNQTIEQLNYELPSNEIAEQSNIEQPNENLDILSSSPVNAKESSPQSKEINIQISEFMPNPLGSDDGEWVEIKNLLNENSDISGWFLDDEDGGNKPYQFLANTIIPANGFLVFYKTQTKISLNNDADSVRILKPTGEVLEKIDYVNGAEGASYARGPSGWSWTTSPTPSAENVIKKPTLKKTSVKKENAPTKDEPKLEIKNSISEKELENAEKNSSMKYYIILGIGTFSALAMQGWKRRDWLKSKYKQLFNKFEARNPKSETNYNDKNQNV